MAVWQWSTEQTLHFLPTCVFAYTRAASALSVAAPVDKWPIGIDFNLENAALHFSAPHKSERHLRWVCVWRGGRVVWGLEVLCQRKCITSKGGAGGLVGSAGVKKTSQATNLTTTHATHTESKGAPSALVRRGWKNGSDRASQLDDRRAEGGAGGGGRRAKVSRPVWGLGVTSSSCLLDSGSPESTARRLAGATTLP